MALRSNGPLTGFGWLARAVNLGHRNAKAVFGGAALVVLAMLLPMLGSMPLQVGALHPGAVPSGTSVLGTLVLSTLLGLLALPAYAGYLRVIDASERGVATRAVDVFAPYRRGEVLRFMGFGLTMALVYFALLGLVLVGTGGGVARWYMQLLASGAQPNALPALPSDFALVFALLIVVMLWLMGVYSIAIGQVALRGRSIVGAVTDGMLGSLKNLLPLVVFAVSLMVAVFIVALCMGIAVAALALLGKVVGLWLTFVLAIPLYLAFFLAMIVVTFGAMYHLWRSVCDDGNGPALEQAIAA